LLIRAVSNGRIGIATRPPGSEGTPTVYEVKASGGEAHTYRYRQRSCV